MLVTGITVRSFKTILNGVTNVAEEIAFADHHASTLLIFNMKNF
jgi:hypothetical protein